LINAYGYNYLATNVVSSSISPDKEKSIRDMLNQIVEGRVDANRRYVDEVLEKVQDENHRYYLDKLVIELAMMEIEEKAGNAQAAFHHKVMVDTYKGLLEKTFGLTT
jgi:DNA polymerase III delta prime subunit